MVYLPTDGLQRFTGINFGHQLHDKPFPDGRLRYCSCYDGTRDAEGRDTSDLPDTRSSRRSIVTAIILLKYILVYRHNIFPFLKHRINIISV